MKIIEVEQGTSDWHALRRCKVTGTKLKRLMGTTESRTNLIAELIAEEATEQTKIVRATAQMERGTEEEIFAIRAFEARTGKSVEKVGICISDDNDWHALSPDGLILDASGDYTEAVEVKCPDTHQAFLYKIENMIDPLKTGIARMTKPTKEKPEAEMAYYATAPFHGIPAEYKWQVVNYFLVNEKLQKLHFCIYDARIISDDAKLYIVEVTREQVAGAMEEATAALKLFREDWLTWRDIVLPLEI